MATINYLNPVHVAVAIEGQLAVDRPNALICPTSNPGEASQHYIALALRVYSDKSDLKSFKGYITFRYCEVRFYKKTEQLPRFSSVELLNVDFLPFNPPRKVHFDTEKASVEDPALSASLATQHQGAAIRSYSDAYIKAMSEACLKKAYKAILDLVDGK